MVDNTITLTGKLFISGNVAAFQDRDDEGKLVKHGKQSYTNLQVTLTAQQFTDLARETLAVKIAGAARKRLGSLELDPLLSGKMMTLDEVYSALGKGTRAPLVPETIATFLANCSDADYLKATGYEREKGE